MHKNRLEAFSDGVIAIIITIMVLEMKVPHSAELSALEPLIPVFFSYLLSFVFLGIYWNNHHHLLQAAKHVNGATLWANMHLLFWLSLVPFTTGWMGENHFARWPVILYGIIMINSAIAYFILVRTLIASHGQDSTIKTAIGSDFKGKISIIIYTIGVLLCFVNTLYACAAYILVSIIWLVPDKRIEKVL